MHRSHRVWTLISFLAVTLLFSASATQRAGADDPIRQMQTDAVTNGKAPWGHWGVVPDQYSQHRTHSNRLIPIYTFGASLDDYKGEKSLYRDAAKIEALYGQVSKGTLNPQAEYMDQTDVFRIQKAALDGGKKYIVLIIFDGLDWVNTRAAAINASGKVGYDSGRGTGLYFQDYKGAPTDFGFFVTSPYNDGSKGDVDAQVVLNQEKGLRGGYDASLGGATPWDAPKLPPYLLGQYSTTKQHAVTDSAASATAMTCGVKTYNDSINVDAHGKKCKTIARMAQAKGYRIGAVTSVPLSHATPAAAYSNNVWRDDYQDIARDMLGLPSVAHKGKPMPGLDVVIGTGWGTKKKKDESQGRNYVSGNKYLTNEDLKTADVANGGKYRVVQRTAGVNGAEALAQGAADAAAKHQRLVGFFGTKYDHLPYQTADGKFDPTSSARLAKTNIPVDQSAVETYSPADLEENPKLKDIASAALTVLSADDKPFWLMIEAGDVDWANHSNNIDNSIGAIRSGDAAFKTVADWMEKHDAWKDSVVIVTADHGHYFVLRDPAAFVGAK